MTRWLVTGPFGDLVIASLIGGFFFLWDWGGYRGKFEPWGDPRSLADIWWHFPLMVLAVAIIIRIFYRPKS